jgi:hypothetical protein
MTRISSESPTRKIIRIYTEEGVLGLWLRVWNRILGIYNPANVKIISISSSLKNAIINIKARAWRTFVRQRVRRDPILIYQMGKVGSMTLEASIRKVYKDIDLDVPIYRSHTLMDFEKAAEIIKSKMGNSSAMLEEVEKERKLRNKIDEEPDKLWNVMTMVRDPVARNIAAFFQNIDSYLPEWKELWESNSLPMQRLLDSFFENEEVNSPFWFETRLELVFGINVYASPFPHQIGYKIYRNPPRADMLLIRLENLNQVASEAVDKFLRIPNFRLLNTNIGSEKPYADVYRTMLRTPLPKSYVKKMYSTALARHFYTETELSAFTRKWTK